MLAAKRGFVNIVKMLIAAGADPSLKTVVRHCSLQQAALHGGSICCSKLHSCMHKYHRAGFSCSRPYVATSVSYLCQKLNYISMTHM